MRRFVEFELGAIQWVVKGSGPFKQGEQPTSRCVQQGLVDLAGLDRRHQRRTVEAADTGHLEVESGPGHGGRGLGGEPVGDDDAVETPFLTKYLGEQPTVLAGERAVHPVVGAHEPPRFGFGHGDLEGPQVDLAQGPVGHDRVDAVAFKLRVVGDEMLDGGADAAALDAPDERSRYSACEHRILRIALEVAATEGRPVDVDGRGEKHVAGAGTGLGGQNCAEFLDQFPIPGGSERRAARDAERRSTSTQQTGATGAVWTVGDLEGGDPETFYGIGVPKAATGHQRGLLLEGEVRQEGVDA